MDGFDDTMKSNLAKLEKKILNPEQVLYHGATKRSASVFKYRILPYGHYRTYYTLDYICYIQTMP